MRPILIIFFAAACATNSMAAPAIHSLSNSDAARWIGAFKAWKTADGSTIAEALQFSQRMRKKRFEFGKFDVNYNASGEPTSVGVEYWIGARRLAGDAYTDLAFDVRRSGAQLSFIPSKSDLPQALSAGRDSFLRAIDQEYRDECQNYDGKTTC